MCKEVQTLIKKLRSDSDESPFAPKIIGIEDFPYLIQIDDYSDLAKCVSTCCVTKFNKLILLGNPLDISEFLKDTLEKNHSDQMDHLDTVREMAMVTCFYILVTNAIYSRNKVLEVKLLSEI